MWGARYSLMISMVPLQVLLFSLHVIDILLSIE
jgi:hypothetical protein